MPPPATARDNGQFADAIAPITYLGGIGPASRGSARRRLLLRRRIVSALPGGIPSEVPRLTNYDLSVFRIVHDTERIRLEYRGEFYNLTNTPHFANPSGTATSATFGIISNTLSGYGNRQVQMALRLKF